MHKEIKVTGSINKNIHDARGIRIHFAEEQVKEWCLFLSLLKFNLIDFIQIHSIEFAIKLIVLRRTAKFKLIARGTFAETDAVIELRITEQELDYWLEFFLIYFRDGIAQVDHIDVEVQRELSRAHDYNRLYLTLLLPNSSFPTP